MKINKEQLVSLLAERTDMDRGEVQRQFVELVGRIQQAESDGNTLEIEGFGTFMVVHDRLEFIPAEIFKTEINNKYAGMKPIELIGAYKEPHGEEVPVAVPSEKGGNTQKPDVPISDESQHEESESEKVEPVSGIEKSSEESESPPTVTDSPVKDKDEETGDEGKDKEEGAKSSAAQKSDHKKIDDTVDSGKSLNDDPLGRAIIIIICILIAAAGAWWAYDAGLFGADATGPDSPPSSTTPAETDQRSEVQPTAPVEGEEPAETSTTDGEQAPGADTKKNNGESASPAESTPYGLHGELNKSLKQGYYTIVIHSLRTMELAKEKKQEAEQKDFRTKINRANVNGSTYYRVGIGQFETIKAAQEAIRELPEPYQSNNFINRF